MDRWIILRCGVGGIAITMRIGIIHRSVGDIGLDINLGGLGPIFVIVVTSLWKCDLMCIRQVAYRLISVLVIYR